MSLKALFTAIKKIAQMNHRMAMKGQKGIINAGNKSE